MLSETEKIDLIVDLMKKVEQLNVRVAELEAHLGMNSSNSSKPPSNDGYVKPHLKSLREKSGRKPGGQKGHPGATLRQVLNPDEIKIDEPQRCVCGQGLDAVRGKQVERRQVFDLPEHLVRVTEHRIVYKQCPHGGRMNRAVAPPEVADWFERIYDDILWRGQSELVAPQKKPGTRGRAKKTTSANLHARLSKHRDAVLRFLRDPSVPFTNNQAERDIRMVKLRQKTSGCERTLAGAKVFARIRSYISTSRKQKKNLFQNIIDAVRGNPWIPQPLAPLS